MNQLLEYALKYASIGWKVFPLAPGKKTPITAHGVKDAASVESVIRNWWTRNPNANIGLACGFESGIYAIDIDEKRDASGKVISDGKIEYSKRFPPLPKTMIQITPRRGLHYLFHHPLGNNNPIGNKVSFIPSVDIRGDGGYIVLAPSRLDPYDSCPDGGVYSWVGGCAPWECATAEYPEFMLTKPVEKPKKISLVYRPAPSPDSNVIERARLYVKECDPAVEGLGGHAKLFWAAQCMVNGFQLSDSQAFSLLASEYNPMCSPPWNLSEPSEHKDFYRKITEARKNPPRDKPVGWLLSESDFSPGELAVAAENAKVLLSEMPSAVTFSETDFEAAIKEEELEKERIAKERNFLSKPTGFLGELCSWINDTSLLHQPIFSLGCSITFLGALFGRKVRDTLGNRTNLYCMGVGGSSTGKDHAPHQIIRLCEASNCLDLIGGINVTGDSAIEERLSRNPATLFLWDEIGHLLADFRTGQHKTLVVPTLMSIWSSAGRTFLGREYADSEKQRKIIQPCCCIWGSTTPDRFARGVTPEELRDGWLGRVLAFQAKGKPLYAEDFSETPVPEHLVAKCHEWMGRGRKVINGTDLTDFVSASFSETAPPQIVVPISKDAKKVMKTFRLETEKVIGNSIEMEYLWAKAVQQGYRIALIVAASEGTPEIVVNASIADYACRLVRFLISDFGKTILPRIAGSELEIMKMKVCDLVRTFGLNGCNKSELTRRTQWVNKASRDGMLQDLIEAGQIFVRKIGNVTRFWTEENYLKKRI